MDLSPFEQGYVTRAFESFFDEENDRRAEMHGHVNRRIPAETDYGFSDLDGASFTILRARCTEYLRGSWDDRERKSESAGQRFWDQQQRGKWTGLPPLSASVIDDEIIFSPDPVDTAPK